MSNLHRTLSDDQIHVAKGFSTGVAGSDLWKNENSAQEFIAKVAFPPALDFKDGNAAPPISPTTGDIYVLVDLGNGAVNSGWSTGPGAGYNDWVRWSGFFWVPITPQEGAICYNKQDDEYYKFDGSDWGVLGGSGSGITGSGTVNRVARFTSSTAIGDGIMLDNGSTMGINAPISATSLISTTSNKDITLDANNSKTTGNPKVISAILNGSATTGTSTGVDALVGDTTGIGIGVKGAAQKGAAEYPNGSLMSNGDAVGGLFKSYLNSGTAYGIIGVAAANASTPSTNNIGAKFVAANGATNYGLQMIDGTEAVGKFIKSVASNGRANWAFITSDDLSDAVPMYISDVTTVNLLDNTANWTSGNYTGTAITGTYQGQKHYNSTYFFECVHDNIWIRILRS